MEGNVPSSGVHWDSYNVPGRWEYPDAGVVPQDGHGQWWGLDDPDAA
jgi:hypothetical protein